MTPFQKILIIRTDRIGDVILTTPAIKALRRAYPKAFIAILVSASTRDLVLGNTDLDEVLVDDHLGRHQGLTGYIRLIRMLRARKFDVVFNFHTKKRTNLLCFLARIPKRVGYRNEKLGFLLNVPVFDDRASGVKHEASYCLDLLKAVGVNADQLDLYVPLQPRAEEWAEDFIKSLKLARETRLIVIHPGASCPTKKWPVERFVALIQGLQKYTAKILLVGGSETGSICAQISRSVSCPVIDLTGKISLAQLTSLLKRCQLMISNDSGPVHVASALGVPVVSIFTRDQPGINPERWRPLGPKSLFVAPKVQPKMNFAKGEILDPGYLQMIQPQEVLEAVDSLFKLC